MSKSAEIALTVHARGVFSEGTLNGTIYPGMVAEVDPTQKVVGGRTGWRPFSGTTGSKGPFQIVLPDFLQGRTKNDEYADGDRVFIYSPARGDELNVRVEEPVGTGTVTEELAVGDYLQLENGGYFSKTTDLTKAVCQVTEDVQEEPDRVSEGTVQVIVL